MAVQTEPSRRFGPKRKALIGAAITVALLGTMGAAQAAIPGAGGVITGCYAKTNGDVRIIDVSKTCLPPRPGSPGAR